MSSEKPPVKKVERQDGLIEYHVIAAEGWDDCASLARFIVKQFGAGVDSQADGICSREWKVRIGAVQIHLKHHDDIGNFFYASPRTDESNALVEQVANELNVRLSGQE